MTQIGRVDGNARTQHLGKQTIAISEPPPDFVIRLSNVLINQAVLAKELETELDRYERSRDGSSNYAQISPPSETSKWQEVARFLDKMGPRIKGLIDQGSVGSACVDFSISSSESTYAKYFTVPAAVAEKAGHHLIDIEVSIYISRPED